MKRPRESPAAAKADRPRPARRPPGDRGAGAAIRGDHAAAALDAAVIFACALVALAIHRRALAAYFGLDDLVIIEQVRGLRPLVVGPWRFLSRQLFFGWAVPAFGANPLPYHVVPWLLHGANAALIYALARRRSAGRLAASAAALLFAASRLHAATLETPARAGEPMALALALAAVLVSDRLGAWRVIAAALFGAAMFAKESVFFLPLVLLVPGGDDSRLGDRARRAAPLLIAGLIAAIVLLMSRAEAAHLGGEAYERAFGANILLNLTTYAHWAVDLHGVLPGQVSAIAAGAWPAGALVTLGLAVLAFAAWRRAPLAAFGAAWWLAALVPVLPLVHHTYLYYLYVPLAGLALALGGAIELARSWLTAAPGAGDRLRSPALAAIVLTLVATHALMSDRLLAERLALHMPGTGIPLDPDLRKSEMARHTAAGVAQGLAGERAGVAFILPSELSQVYSTATGAKQAPGLPDSVSYPMLEGALDGGAGLRVLVANVDSVAFLPGWKPGYGAFEMFSQSADGTVFPLGRGADGFASAGAAMRRSGDVAPAVRLLAGAVGEFPDVARLRYEYAHALYVIGDSLGSRRELTELLRRNPTDTLAARVRADFGRTQGAAARR